VIEHLPSIHKTLSLNFSAAKKKKKKKEKKRKYNNVYAWVRKGNILAPRMVLVLLGTDHGYPFPPPNTVVAFFGSNYFFTFLNCFPTSAYISTNCTSVFLL
jgi:hypothetical protein